MKRTTRPVILLLHRAKFLSVVLLGLWLSLAPAWGNMVTFTFEGLGQGYSDALPVTFSQDGLDLAAHSSLGRFVHSDYLRWFPLIGISGGALVDPFRLTQLPGYPAETLTLSFNREVPYFQANFGVLVDFYVVENPTPASLQLEAFLHGVPVGNTSVTPTGGPPFYAGQVSFGDPFWGFWPFPGPWPPGVQLFDQVVFTTLTDPNAGGPEFIIDNVQVAAVPEPSNAAAALLACGGLGLYAFLRRRAAAV